MLASLFGSMSGGPTASQHMRSLSTCRRCSVAELSRPGDRNPQHYMALAPLELQLWLGLGALGICAKALSAGHCLDLRRVPGNALWARGCSRFTESVGGEEVFQKVGLVRTSMILFSAANIRAFFRQMKSLGYEFFWQTFVAFLYSLASANHVFQMRAPSQFAISPIKSHTATCMADFLRQACDEWQDQAGCNSTMQGSPMLLQNVHESGEVGILCKETRIHTFAYSSLVTII